MTARRNLLHAALALGVAALLSGWAAPALAKVNVFACEPEWAALAKEIGGDAITVYSATTAQQDPHAVQARPSLIARLRNADLLICSGSELEIGWLPLLLIQSANGSVQAGAPGHLMVGDFVTHLEIPARFDRALGDLHPMGNPHIQTDPRNIAVAGRELVQRLSAIDPAQEALYQSRYQDFSKRWDAAIRAWETKAAPLRGIVVVAYHVDWAYLNDWLGIQQGGFLEPKPGVPPSTAHLNTLLAQLKARPPRMVLRTPYEAPQAADFVAQRMSVPHLVLPSTVGGSDRAKDLFGLFDDVIDRLLQGLQGKSLSALPGTDPVQANARS
jgi:zinc/manganese transport system substrate-binding protein